MISAKWDLTSNCNLRCSHCSVANMYFDKQNPVKDLSQHERLTIVDRLADGGVTSLSLLGGEPLTLREDLWALLEHAKKRQLSVHLVTNATLLNSDASKRLIDCGLDRLVVSIDGPTAGIHNKIRGNRTFEKTTRNLQQFLSLRGAKDAPKLSVNSVLCAHNRDAFTSIIPFCRDLGADSWNALTMNYIGNAYNHLGNLSLSQQEHTEVALDIGLLLKQPDFDVGQLKINLTLICPLVWEYLCKKFQIELPQPQICCSASSSLAYISPTGDMHLCDRVDSSDYTGSVLKTVTMHPENLLTSDFETIWNSQQYIEMYDFVRGNDAYSEFDPCNHCKYFFDRSCNPCPLQSYRMREVKFEECLKAEQYLGDISRYQEENQTHWEQAHQFNPISLAGPVPETYKTIRNAYPTLTQGVRSAQQDNECFLSHPKSLQTVKINHSGLEILRMMDGSQTTDEIVDVMVDLYRETLFKADALRNNEQIETYRTNGVQAFVMYLYEEDFIKMGGGLKGRQTQVDAAIELRL